MAIEQNQNYIMSSNLNVLANKEIGEALKVYAPELKELMQKVNSIPRYDQKHDAIKFSYYHKGKPYPISIKTNSVGELIMNYGEGKDMEVVKSKVNNLDEFNTVLGGVLNLMVKDSNRPKIPEIGKKAYNKYIALKNMKEAGLDIDKNNTMSFDVRYYIGGNITTYNIKIFSQNGQFKATLNERGIFGIKKTFTGNTVGEAIGGMKKELLERAGGDENYELKQRVSNKLKTAKETYESLVLGK